MFGLDGLWGQASHSLELIMSHQIVAHFDSSTRASFAVNSLHDCGVREVYFWTEAPLGAHRTARQSTARIRFGLDDVHQGTVMNILERAGGEVVNERMA
jgi:hypothetical protein